MENINDVLSQDPLALAEKFTNKNWGEFNEKRADGVPWFGDAYEQQKEQSLKSRNDTYFNMTWIDFKDLLVREGFKQALQYDIVHERGVDEAIIYYRNDGLIVWATSYFNKESVNEGDCHGELKYEEGQWNNTWKALTHFSHGSSKNNTVIFSTDVREGLIGKINELAKCGQFNKQWVEEPMCFSFVDYVEGKGLGYDFKARDAITRNKIMKCNEEIQYILTNYMK